MKKLLLIHPLPRSGETSFSETEAWGMPPLNLGYVAALTPNDWHIKIVDEYVEKINLSEKPDLVGITAYTANVTKAYELAQKFKDIGVPTVLGGIHASMMPDESIKYVDSIVVGEAESSWGKVISDFNKGKLKRKYIGERLPLINLPLPRRDLFADKYQMDIVQTTRGCPFNCEFCCVTAFNGREYRQRPIEDVINELKSIKKKVVYFIDDNILGIGKKAEERALKLFKGMIDNKINKYWATQVSFNIAENEELLKYAYKAGCRSFYIGIETIRDNILKDLEKGINVKIGVDGFKKAISTIHKHGITICGSFILGNDNEDIKIFKELVQFIRNAKIDVYYPNILTPLPGTKLFNRLKKENRMIYSNFPDDWDKCDEDQVNIIPKNMTVEQLVRGYDFTVYSIFSRFKIIKQFFKTLFITKSLIASIISYSGNKANYLFLTNRIKTRFEK
jgi:radical SAM superfamily enzyme YgiQ (UPF0313 family)